jgi:hypothetical protein
MKILLIFFLVGFSALVFAQNEEEKALKDWERIQENYPQTTIFKKLGNNKYYIQNGGFYSGNIVIKNIIIEESTGHFSRTVDFDISYVDEDNFPDTDGYTFARWEEANHLVFDEKLDRWVRHRDASGNNGDARSILKRLFVAIVPILILIIVIYLAIRFLNKRSENVFDKLVESNVEIAKEVKRIGDILERYNPQK